MVATVVTYVRNLDVFQIRKRGKESFSWKEFENQLLKIHFTLITWKSSWLACFFCCLLCMASWNGKNKYFINTDLLDAWRIYYSISFLTTTGSNLQINLVQKILFINSLGLPTSNWLQFQKNLTLSLMKSELLLSMCSNPTDIWQKLVSLHLRLGQTGNSQKYIM